MGCNKNNRNKILILIADGSYTYDTRVKQEANSLTKAGYEVSVICPLYPEDQKHEISNGIHIYRYRKWSRGGYLGEFSSSLIKGFWLACHIKKKHGIDCIQACNPPDIWFLLALVFKSLFGTKFIFDQHDLCPELYLSKFNKSTRSWGFRLMLALERMTYLLADGVISTNESYKRIAMERGKKSEHEVRVVRNGPDLDKFRLSSPDLDIKKKGRIITGYLGNMNSQDGVENLLHAIKYIVYNEGRRDFYFIFIGSGDSLDELISISKNENLESYVRFTGRLVGPELVRCLSSCDICVQPDSKNPFNDLSTMTKAMEYMALGKPVVAFDLKETRYSCGDCALYAKPNDAEDLAQKILVLGDDAEMRSEMGRMGKERVENFLAWSYSERNLIDMYRSVFEKD